MAETAQVIKEDVLSVLKKRSVQDRFEELMGDRSAAFVTSLISLVSENNMLKNADPQSVLNAAATAASMNLPINPSLGQAYVVPYNSKDGVKAQFQIGWKGLVQLAQRTKQYEKINVIVVHENQFKGWNALTEELDGDFTIEGTGKVIGYVAYFKLLSGYSKVDYWSREKVERHAKKYSQSYKKGFGTWADGEDGFNAMGKKTVLKLILDKWGVKSIEMERAALLDQAVVGDDMKPNYVDRQLETPEQQADREEENRTIEWITKAEDIDQLEKILDKNPNMGKEAKKFYDLKAEEFKKK